MKSKRQEPRALISLLLSPILIQFKVSQKLDEVISSRENL